MSCCAVRDLTLGMRFQRMARLLPPFEALPDDELHISRRKRGGHCNMLRIAILSCTAEEQDVVRRSRAETDRIARTRTGSAQYLLGIPVAGRLPHPPATAVTRAIHAFTPIYLASGTVRYRRGQPIVQPMNPAVLPSESAREFCRRKGQCSQTGSFARPKSEDGVRVYLNNKEQRQRHEKHLVVCGSTENATYHLQLSPKRQDQSIVPCREAA